MVEINAPCLETKDQLTKLLNMTADPVFIHIDGVIVYANPAASETFGVTDFTGCHVMDFVHEDSRDIVISRMKAIQTNVEELALIEEKAVDLNGNVLFVEVSGAAIHYNGKRAVQLIVRDITKTKHTLQQLHESEEKYRLLAEYATDLIVLVNEELCIEYASPSFEKRLGLFPSNMTGAKFTAFLHPDDHEKALMLSASSHLFSREIRFKSQCGRFIWTEANSNVTATGAILITARDITERIQYEEHLKSLAYYDGLTNIPNRLRFGQELNKALSHGEPFALLYLDCDRFKHINDTMGHDTGDEVLKEFAARAQQVTGPCGKLYRLGGDEFIILLTAFDDPSSVEQVAKRITVAMAKPWTIHSHTFHVTTSIGISLYPNHAADKEHLLKYADTALYEAKNSGRNTYRFFKGSNKMPVR